MDIIQTQIVFFFKNDYKKDFETFSLKIKELFGQSTQTLQIPLGNAEPSELPRLVLTYEGFILNISKNRLDCTIQKNEIYDTIKTKIITFQFNKLSLEISRLGFIRTYFKETDPSSIKYLLNENLQKKNFRDINLQVNELFSFNKYDCNNLEKIDAGKLNKKEAGATQIHNGLIIQRDINTSAELDVILDSSQIPELVNHFEKKSNEFLLFNGD